MNDLISRQAALYSYQEVCNKVKCSECKATNEDGDCKLERWIKELPSAERRGQWIRTGEDGFCSVCKCDMPMFRNDWEWEYTETPYCPNCGARMEAE